MMIDKKKQYVIASTWCHDSAMSMREWCCTIPHLHFLFGRSFSDCEHTIVLDTDTSELGQQIKALFLQALLEDEDMDEGGGRWEYVEVSQQPKE